MKYFLLISTFLFFGCGDSAEKKELEKLRDSIRIIHSLKHSDPNVFSSDLFDNNGNNHRKPSAEEMRKMEEDAQRTADSIAKVIEKMNAQ